MGGLRLVQGKADPDRTFYPADSCSHVRAKQAGIGGFIREATNRGEPKVDGRGGVAGLLEEDPIAGNYGFVERQSACKNTYAASCVSTCILLW
jgi:hypothetical protein